MRLTSPLPEENMKSIVLCERTLVQESENFSTLKDEIINEESNEKEEEEKVLNGIPDSRKSASADVDNIKKDGVSLQNGDKSTGMPFEEDVTGVDEKDWEPSMESDNRVGENVLTSENDSVEEVVKSSVCSTRDETVCCEKLTSENEILENLETRSSGENENVNGDVEEESVQVIEEEKSVSSPQHTGKVEEEELKMESEERVQQMEGIALEMDENKENMKEEKANGVDVFSGNNLKKLSSECEIQVGEVQTISGAEKDSIWAESDFKKCVQDSKEKSDEKVKCDCSGDTVSNEETVNSVGDEKENECMDLICEENVISEEEDMNIEVDESEQTAEEKVEKESHLTRSDKSVTDDEDRASRSGTREKTKSAICRKRQKPEGSIEEDTTTKKKRLVEEKEAREQMLSEEENTEDSSRCESVASLDSTGASTKDQTLEKAKPRTTKKASTDEEDEKKSKASVGDEESEVKKHKTTESRFSVLEKFRGTLKTLTRSDLEELIIQKLCEVITERSNVGELRRKAQALEEDQERWKSKAQSLAKQMREMEMVMKKYMAEVQKQVKEGESHVVTPLKVTRSVGLQVSFYSSASKGPKANVPQSSPNLPQNANSRNVKSTPPKTQTQFSPTNPNLRNKPSPSFQKGAPSVQKSPVSQQRRPIAPKPDYISTPASRPVPQQSPGSNTRVSSQVQAIRNNFKSIMGTSPQQQPQQSQSHQQQQLPQSQQQQQQQNGSKVIDLTDDDDRQTGNVVVKTSGPIRVVNHLPQSPSTQNNRFAYLLPTSSASPTATPAGQNRQVLIAAPAVPQPNRQIMCSMPPLLFKGGNVVQSGSQPQMLNQSNKHPAPLPKRPINQNTRPSLKLIPPRPALKISKVQTGIVLSWNMALSQEHAPIASYQLYAYQESDSPPTTSLWKKVGDVKALPLPMACTLTQFMSGHKYHFAVRAVDLHSRIGPFSFPGTIVLV